MAETAVPVRLEGPPLELLDLTVAEVVDRAPAGVAAVAGGAELSYDELRERSVAVARGLVALGVRKGDRVALASTNRIEFPVLLAGAARAGAITVPVNTWLRPEELRRLLGHSGASVAIAEEEFRGRRFRDTVEGLRPGLPALRHVLPLEAVGELEAAAAGQALPALDREDPALLIYTSGTTGRQKGCLHVHRSLVNNAHMNTLLKRMTPADRVIASVPFFNAFGIVNCLLEAFLAGATVVVQRTFEPGETLELIERERVTILLGTPTMWIRLLEHPRFPETDVSSLRTGTMAGAPCPPELVARWRELGCDPVVIYGLSEAPSILANGRPSPGITVVLDEDGQLTASGYNQMLGYYLEPELTAERIRDGWLQSGDLAALDAEGRIAIRGRADDMAIVGGFNVHPAEVEDVLRGHPAVADAAAFGIPDRELGEVLAAWLLPRAGAALDPDEVRAYARERLAAYKVPRVLRVVEEFPLTANGKVQRYRMREETAAAP